MTVHYHGLPLTPASEFEKMGGRNFCISYATCRGRPAMVARALSLGQAVMWDNGAFTFFTQSRRTWLGMDRRPLYEWLEPYIGHPHWCVVPDVIDAPESDQRVLTAEWPFPREFGAPVWHLDKPLDYLLELADSWPRVCLGSAGAYWKVGAPQWRSRMDEVFNFLIQKRRHMPNIHGLRMLGQIGERWPIASADSVNVARNFSTRQQDPCCMAARIDAVQGPWQWVDIFS